MRIRTRRLIVLAALVGTMSLSNALPAAAKPTCGAQVAKAEKAYFGALLGKATKACGKAPGATCFNVTAPKVPSAKKLKLCKTADDVSGAFNGKCVSRDPSCVPATLASADDAAKCITCQVQSAVTCLTASAFAPTHVPPGCIGSPSGAFVDSDDDIPSPAAVRGNAR